MIIIADSGSTKTQWWVGSNDATEYESGRVELTPGINPMQMSADQMQQVLAELTIPQSATGNTPNPQGLHRIYFYGAGCRPDTTAMLAALLRKKFGDDAELTIDSDIYGAAFAACGHNEGLVGILGTGSNSCLFDGSAVVANVSPLGYILGDEGSGAYIGKKLVNNVLKQQFRPSLCQAFLTEMQTSAADIVQRTYRGEAPNRFLASLSRFCSSHRDDDEIHALLVDSFSEFFHRNIALYQRPDLVVNFVGSVAWQYADELHIAAQRSGFTVGTIQKEPLPAMVGHILHTRP